jgi:tetratricopeptide (TPR) repeat protein
LAAARPSRRWLAAALPCLAAALAVCAACSSPEERFATHMQRAQQFLEEDRVQEAILEFSSALDLQPQNAEVHERIGEAFVAHGRLVEALPYFQQAFRLDETRLTSAMHEARLVAAQDRARARELVALGLARAPELAAVQRAAAHLAVLEGNSTRALQAAMRAVELEPDDAANWAELAIVHEARLSERLRAGRPVDPGVHAAALEALDRVDQLEGGSPRARLDKARVLLAQPGRQAEAAEEFERALELATRKASPSEIRFVAHAIDDYGGRVGDNRLRRRAWRAAVEAREDDYESWDSLARLMGRRGEEIHLELLDRRPDDPRSHLLYAAYLQRSGREPDAEAHLRRAIEDGVSDPRLWEQLFTLKLGTAAYAEARAVYVEMVERHPDARETRMVEARLALAEMRLADARGILRRVVAEDERNHEVHRLLALTEMRLSNLGEAREEIALAERFAPTPHFPTLRLKARIAEESGDWREVVQTYRVVAGRGEELSPEERVRLARALERAGSRKQARELLRELMALPEPPPEAALELAAIESARDPEAAHALLLAALERAPAHPELLVAVTRSERGQGRSEQALARLDAVVTAGAATPRILLLRAELLAAAGATEQAEADVLRAFEANPMLPGAIELLFSIYRSQDRLDEARHSFEQAEQAGVLHPGARLLLARFYSAAGDLPRARAALERVLEEQPDLWPAKRDLALVLAEQGQERERALALAREALRDAGSDPSAADALGYVHLKAGRAPAALQQFQRAARWAQDADGEVDPTLRYHFGLALLALGRSEEAARAFETALQQGDFPQAEDARRQLEAARHPEAPPASPS